MIRKYPKKEYTSSNIDKYLGRNLPQYDLSKSSRLEDLMILREVLGIAGLIISNIVGKVCTSANIFTIFLDQILNTNKQILKT